MVGVPATALAPQRAVLTLDGEIVPYTRVLRGEQSDAAERYRGFRGEAALRFGQQWGRRPLLGDKATILEIDIIVTLAANRLWTVDADNLAKGILDALNGVVLKDDRWVSRVGVAKQPARPIVGLAPGARIEILWHPLAAD